ncbi:MAG: triose-phosphate isomerase [Betaproteobacteria bacterium]|nr:triose-phosphate isomerase [Betaproteobacteria bacterium]
MRHRFVIGNWKLNGSLAKNKALLDVLRSTVTPKPEHHCAVCVPAPYLPQVQSELAGSAISWGSQDVSIQDSGAYTGEVSATMVTEFGSRFAIVGHSERRALFGETDTVVAAKFGRAMVAGLTPVLCVGETLAEREANQTDAVVARQLNAVIDAQGIESLSKAVLAYEPVWAIGTGKTATPDQAQAVHAFLRGLIARTDAAVAASLPILYGGSVKKSNAKELFSMPDIDGGLVGGASLIADEFLGIWAAL